MRSHILALFDIMNKGDRAVPARSSSVRGPHAPGNFGALLPLDHADVVLALQVEPELRAVPSVRVARPYRH
jgi:hypothetical protein